MTAPVPTVRSTAPPVAWSTAPAAAPPGLARTAGALLLLALVAYLPAALRAQFLGFDDNFFFGPDNPEFRDGLAAVFAPARPIANAWLPIAHASLWLDWWLGGGRPLLPHLTSLLLHALAGVLFVRLLLRLRLPALPAHVAGALFVVHPALAESVAWVSGRKEVLSGLFVFAALLATAQAAHRPTALRFLAIALCGALAMYAKATAVVLPLLALLVCFAAPGARARFLAPASLALVVAPIALHHRAYAVAEGTLAAGSAADRLAQVPGALLHYLQQTFWPSGLNVLHPEVQTLGRFAAELGPGLAAAGGLLLAALLAACWTRTRAAAAGLAAFALALLPFNTAWPASSIAAADRYLYLAVPGAAVALVALLRGLSPRHGVFAAAACVVPLLWLCGSRAHEFGDTETLWRSSLAVEPDNAVARLNLVEVLRSRRVAAGELAAARDEIAAHLEKAAAAARYPVHRSRAELLLMELAMQRADRAAAASHARAAIAAAAAEVDAAASPQRLAQARERLLRTHVAAFAPLRAAHDAAGAEASLRSAREIAPGHPDVVAFEAMLALEPVAAELAALGAAGVPQPLAETDPRGLEVDRRLGAALAAHPGHAMLLVAQASWDRVRGRALAALRNYRRAEDADPTCLEAWLGAAQLLRERESWSDALQHAEGGLRHCNDPTLLQEQALALVGLGRLDDAIVVLERRLAVDPGDADAAKVLSNVLVGRAYARLGEPGGSHREALKLVERALTWNPKEPRAHVVLGRIAYDLRRFAEAVRHFEQACRIMPDYDEARELLADSLDKLGFERMLARDDDGAADCWLRCLQLGPKQESADGIRRQLQRIWRQHEQRGLDLRQAGDLAGAEAEFRSCLRIDPQQHWGAWLLATTLQQKEGADLAELERLCREAVAGQQQNGLDRSQQVWLLAHTLQRRGDGAGARAVATAYLAAPDADAKPNVLSALRALAGG